MKRFVTWLIGAPIALAAILLSVANRGPVTFSLDPFSLDEPALKFELPLFVLLFAAVFVGLVVGWFVGLGSSLSRRRQTRDASPAEPISQQAPQRESQALLPPG